MDAKEVVADSVKFLRKTLHQDMPLAVLSTRLADLGVKIDPIPLGRLERAERDVKVGELLALAAALGVSPSALLSPNGVRLLEVGPHRLDASQVKAWLSGDPDALERRTADLSSLIRKVQDNRLLSDLAEEMEMLDQAVRVRDRAASFWLLARIHATLAALQESFMTQDELNTVWDNYGITD